MAKTLLTCLVEPPADTYEQAVVRGKLRYDRFLKSVGAGMEEAVGVILFQKGGRLRSLEVYSLADTYEPFGLPEIETIHAYERSG